MEIEWLVANIPAVGFPAGAESVVFIIILTFFWQIQVTIVAGEPLCDLEIPS